MQCDAAPVGLIQGPLADLARDSSLAHWKHRSFAESPCRRGSLSTTGTGFKFKLARVPSSSMGVRVGTPEYPRTSRPKFRFFVSEQRGSCSFISRAARAGDLGRRGVSCCNTGSEASPWNHRLGCSGRCGVGRRPGEPCWSADVSDSTGESESCPLSLNAPRQQISRYTSLRIVLPPRPSQQ